MLQGVALRAVGGVGSACGVSLAVLWAGAGRVLQVGGGVGIIC